MIKKLLAVIIAVALIAVLWLTLSSVTSRGRISPPPEVSEALAVSPSPSPAVSSQSEPTPTAVPSPTPEPEPSYARLTVAGDIVMHEGINQQAWSDGDGVYDYTKLFDDVRGYIEDADLASCCMETTFFGDGNYTGYPMFRSPDELAYSLSDVGFDLIATASNHALDSWKTGLDRTLDILDAAGLSHVGTYRTQEERDENSGIVVKDVNGISIAFLDYSYGTNGLPKEDYPYAVNVYYIDYMTNFYYIDYDMVNADMAAARALGTDLIAVIVHWGIEYRTTPGTEQTDFADYLFEQGADLVLGGHPHVPQSMEMRTITNADGTTRKGFVCYCLSNLLSTMNDDYTYLTAILQIDIKKDNATGETTIENAGYIPVVQVDLNDYGIYNAGWRYRLWDLYAAVADYEAGNTRGVMNDSMYSRFLQHIESLKNICGGEYDLKANGGISQ